VHASSSKRAEQLMQLLDVTTVLQEAD